MRPHPRTHAALHARLRELCAAFDGGGTVRMLYDEAHDDAEANAQRPRRLDNTEVIRGSVLTLSIGSGTALESLSFGTPAAFLQHGWPSAAAFQSTNYAWLAVPRIGGGDESHEQLRQLLFPDGGANAAGSMDAVLRSCAEGALAKTWAAIEHQFEQLR